MLGGRGIDETGRDRVGPDPRGGPLGRELLRQPDHTGLGRSMSRKPHANLADHAHHRRSVDDHTALVVVRERLGGRHRGRGQAHDVERPDQVDADDEVERVPVVRRVVAVDHPARPAHARAAHRDAQGRALSGDLYRGLHLFDVGHVRDRVPRATSELSRQRLRPRLVAVDDGHRRARLGERADGGLPQARSSTRHQRGCPLDLHGAALYASLGNQTAPTGRQTPSRAGGGTCAGHSSR